MQQEKPWLTPSPRQLDLQELARLIAIADERAIAEQALPEPKRA